MNILVAIDLSESMEKIVKKAEEFSQALSAKLWLLHVAEPEPDFVGLDVGPQSVRDAHSKRFHADHRQVQAIADRLRKAGLDATALVVQGATVEMILKEAGKLNVDMIIAGSHGHSAMVQLLLGSVSDGILRKSRWPVLIVPTHERS